MFRHLFASIAEEMGVTLQRSSFSANIKERRDYSCALFDGAGRLVAQAAHIPVHLGSTGASVRAAIEGTTMGRGDVVILNDPFAGGTHLPDITLVAPVFLDPSDTAPTFHVANRAHHADVGGAEPGSMALTTSIDEEGLRLPPVHLIRGGARVRETFDLIRAAVRTPDEREGDLRAQVAANRRGEARLREVEGREGRDAMIAAMDALRAYSARRMRATIAALPDGCYDAVDLLEDDGAGTEDIEIRVSISIRGDRAIIDFTGSAPQVRGNVNANEAVTLSAVLYAFLTLAGPDVPPNDGCLEPLELITQPGTVVHALPPAAVAGGNVETSQRIVDVLYAALRGAAPDRVPAASAGTMSNFTFGGRTEAGRVFTHYETIAGGMGARPGADGLDAVQTHMTNTRNTPIEALEALYPVRVTRYAVRRGSGGAGRFRGGDGVVREFEARARLRIGLLTERRRLAPSGAEGGEPGRAGANVRIDARGAESILAAKTAFDLGPGERVRIETPGGGGFGDARTTR